MAMAPGNRLRELRKAHGVEAERLALELGVTAGTIGRYERGDSQIPDSSKVRLAQIFGVSISWLMAWSEEGAPPEVVTS